MADPCARNRVRLVPPGPAPAVRVPVPGAQGPKGDSAGAAINGVATAAIAPGMALVLTGAALLTPADASALALSYVVGLARTEVAPGYPVKAERLALTLPDWTGATGAEDLVPDRDYFLAALGQLAPVPDVASGHCTVRIGRSIDRRTLALAIDPPFLN